MFILKVSGWSFRHDPFNCRITTLICFIAMLQYLSPHDSSSSSRVIIIRFCTTNQDLIIFQLLIVSYRVMISCKPTTRATKNEFDQSRFLNQYSLHALKRTFATSTSDSNG